MNLSDIFAYYDKIIFGIPKEYSALISLAILLLLFWSLWRFLKGNFVWIIGILIFVPALWPALKTIGKFFTTLSTFLLIHIKP